MRQEIQRVRRRTRTAEDAAQHPGAERGSGDLMVGLNSVMLLWMQQLC